MQHQPPRTVQGRVTVMAHQSLYLPVHAVLLKARASGFMICGFFVDDIDG